MQIYKLIPSTVLSIALLACSGGSGGGGGTSTETSLSRNDHTAVRIIHAGLDATPISLRVNGQEEVLTSARFAQSTFYQSIDSGAGVIAVERINSPGTVIATFAQSFEENTEYTVFLYGEGGGIGLSTEIKQDIVSRPEEGFSLVNVYNGYIQDSVTVNIGSTSLGTVAFGGAGSYVQTTSGPQTITVLNSDGGTLATAAISLPDRGDVSILVTGSSALGITLTPIFQDLD